MWPIKPKIAEALDDNGRDTWQDGKAHDHKPGNRERRQPGFHGRLQGHSHKELKSPHVVPSLRGSQHLSILSTGEAHLYYRPLALAICANVMTFSVFKIVTGARMTSNHLGINIYSPNKELVRLRLQEKEKVHSWRKT